MSSGLDPVAFWHLARQLAADTDDQARLRTAVGRAYYATFIVARDWTGVVDRRDAHRNVLHTLNARNQGALASELDRLRKLRDVADYEMLPLSASHADWSANWLRAAQIGERILEKYRMIGVLAS